MKTFLVGTQGSSRSGWRIVCGVALAAGSWGAVDGSTPGAPGTFDLRATAPTWEQRAANAAGGELSQGDREFVVTSLGASRQQARLAAMGILRAASSDVRSLAQQLETDFRSLSDSLDAIWRRTGSVAGPAAGGAGESAERVLADKSGAAFDREFVRVVTQANGRLLTAFEQAVSSAKDPGVRELAARQLPVLRAHRTTLTELHKLYD
jgi:putative membrane protein